VVEAETTTGRVLVPLRRDDAEALRAMLPLLDGEDHQDVRISFRVDQIVRLRSALDHALASPVMSPDVMGDTDKGADS
jgi:hypothetical protein